jgi:serine/threonine protein kinase
MSDFFEDDINYYIEMIPHGLPGMDLFDYIEMRSTMEEAECRNIFRQVVTAVHHLHTKALVVHRDIKDENVILDGEGAIKLIDFGSAAYIKTDLSKCLWGPSVKYHASCPEANTDRTYNRLRGARSSSREFLPWQRARRLGPRHSLHHRLQGEPFLQHRRDYGPRAQDTMDHERAEY